MPMVASDFGSRAPFASSPTVKRASPPSSAVTSTIRCSLARAVIVVV